MNAGFGSKEVPAVKEAVTRSTIGQISITRPLVLLLAVVLCGCQSQPGSTLPASTPGEAPPPPAILQSVEYEVRETLTLVNEGPGRPAKQNIWLALIRNLPPYQTVHSMEISPRDYQLITDEYGNQYAEFDLSDMPAGETVQIKLQYTVSVHEPAYDLAGCTGDVPDEFTQAELHVESNNIQIVELSQGLSKGQNTVCEQVRAFYDYVGNSLVYSYNGADWGAQAALGEMGADCTEYASLMMALSRAAGIPARYLEGVWAGGETRQNDARTEHAWLEVYLPGVGWTPMDPTLGRSSIGREETFAHLPPDHIIVTVGRNPSTLRGASYFTHLYWPGKSTEIRVTGFEWEVTLAGE
jgi:transglutaminase-like putative cysteine protease